jgi:hypothetical protein
MKKLYDTRSKAVHGSQLDAARLAEHILAVRSLLSRLLCHFIQAAHVPDEQELELAVLS